MKLKRVWEANEGDSRRRGRPKLQWEDSLKRSKEGGSDSHTCVTFAEDNRALKELMNKTEKAMNVT